MPKRSPTRRTGRLKKAARKSIRRVSKERAALNEVAGPWREKFKQEIGKCEICGTQSAVLDPHEITGGWARKYTMTNRACILVLCRACHHEVELSPAMWTIAKQAAVLRRNRAADFCLETLNRWLIKQLSLYEVDYAAGRLTA